MEHDDMTRSQLSIRWVYSQLTKDAVEWHDIHQLGQNSSSETASVPINLNSDLKNIPLLIPQMSAEKEQQEETQTEKGHAAESGKQENMEDVNDAGLTGKEEADDPSADSSYRCPYCFLQMPNKPTLIESHLLMEYSLRGIQPFFKQLVLKNKPMSQEEETTSGKAPGQ